MFGFFQLLWDNCDIYRFVAGSRVLLHVLFESCEYHTFIPQKS